MSTSNKKELQIDLKEEYVKYFEDVPVQKYAAMYIKRDEDTVIRWKKQDLDFADRVNQAKAKWVRKMLIKTKAEFALERLERQIFDSKQEAENPYPVALVKFMEPIEDQM